MKEIEIFKIRQHKIKMVIKTIWTFVLAWAILGTILYLITQSSSITGISVFILGVFIYSYYYFFWRQSYFLVTSESLSIHVRNGLFSQYNMRVLFKEVKDMAYSKNHFLHYIFNYWVLFIRTSAAGDGSFIIGDIPKIEDIYKKISYMHSIWESWRNSLVSTDVLEKKQTKSKDEIIKDVKNTLLSIRWIVEVELLTNQDKKFIFENEEDRNHGVYECIKREVTFMATHDSSFRNADAPIVLKLWSKVIFPPVSFHEITEKNTVSSSPWVEVHNYLIKKLKHIWEYDATLLIWFDI